MLLFIQSNAIYYSIIGLVGQHLILQKELDDGNASIGFLYLNIHSIFHLILFLHFLVLFVFNHYRSFHQSIRLTNTELATLGMGWLA